MERAKGFDVSGYQPKVDWDKVLTSGVTFAGIKATEGERHVDSALVSHRDGFRAHPFTLGIYYHFARSGDPVVQAKHLAKTVGTLKSHERLCLDVEMLPTPGHPEQAIGWVGKFFGELLGNACGGTRPLIYTSARIWRSFGDPGWALASEVDLWCPRYNNAGIEPLVPRPWQQSGWTIWQYTDGHEVPHVVPGVGPCDGNYFRGDLAALKAYAAGLPPVPPAAPRVA